MWGSHKKRGLRNWVVMILRRGPRTGAQIMDDMEVMTRGWWRPSPGSIYPLLDEMVGEGSLKRNPDGRFELTESGSRGEGFWPWMQPPRTAKEVVGELSGLTSYLEDLSRGDPNWASGVGDDLKGVVRRLDQLTH